MKNGIIISILTAIIVYFYVSENATLSIIATVLVVLSLTYLFSKQTIIYNYYKSKISNFEEGTSTPFIDVNKVSWKILTLIPKIDKMTAKHIVYNRRHLGNYKNFNDFFKINQMSEEKQKEIKKYIVIH
ncbi:MAG: helix-hairpin-helix domain-containing protein [Candidatus Gastranaerophilales bacterium]|nr:helix-hairpin-helix domain-containing protein [Candidatus Gastranaerophilales bacterium]